MKLLTVIISISIMILFISCASVQLRPEQIEDIKTAAAKVLPPEAKVEVTTKSRFLSKPDLVISAHLLEGHSADDNNPYVRGDYGTHDKLTRLVRHRCARVIKSVVKETQLNSFSKIIVQGCHGVRQYYSSIPIGGTDVAMNIYIVSIPLQMLDKEYMSKIDEDKIMSLWSVEKNIIPELEIRSTYF